MRKTLKIVSLIALFAILATVLVACIPNDPAKAEDNLNNAKYTVLSYKEGDVGFSVATRFLEIIGVKNVTAFVTATKGEDGIALIYFEDSAAAKENYTAIEEYYKEEDKDAVIKRSGKVIYAGTEQAIKDVK